MLDAAFVLPPASAATPCGSKNSNSRGPPQALPHVSVALFDRVRLRVAALGSLALAGYNQEASFWQAFSTSVVEC